MTDEMVKIQMRFNRVRDLVQTEDADRVLPELEDLRICVLWELGLVTCWKPIVKGDYGQQTANCN